MTELTITEVRILAIMQDSSIVDKHTATAAELFSIAEFEVTKEQRRVAKHINFFKLYGDIKT